MTVSTKRFSSPGTLRIALAGQPNTGKSTVFNQLTGAHQHVGNWPGKTVEQKKGFFNFKNVHYQVVDLPGTYSLTANSLEETISRDYILEEKPDAVIVLVDAAQLGRTLYLVSELLSLPAPVVVALNMMDIAEKEGRKIDLEALQKQLGVPVVPMVAAKNRGVSELVEVTHHYIRNANSYSPFLPVLKEDEKELLAQIQNIIRSDTHLTYPAEWLACKLLEEDKKVWQLVRENLTSTQWNEVLLKLNKVKDGALLVAGARYDWIQQVIDHSVSHEKTDADIRRGKFDRVATHPFWGILLAVLIVLLAFAASMIIALPLMTAVTSSLPFLIEWIRQSLVDAPAWIPAMLADGVFPGVGMALSYLGFLFGVYFMIGVVEDVGYMARIAFVTDRFMARIGLHGKSFLPMFSSLGCNITGVLGSRVVDSWPQRMMTMIMAPIVPCLAVWGVTGFFGTLFFGAGGGLITIALLVTLFAWLALTGFLFKRFVAKEEQGGLIMELPPYHKPNWKTIWRFTWTNTKSFIMRGFTLVAGASLVIWALSYLPNGEIGSSYLASIGKILEPLGNLMGLDWMLMVALVASMVSKETSIATLGVIYGLPAGLGGTSLTGLVMGAEAVEQSAVASVLQASISPASALAFIFAVFFSIPCLGTIGAIRSESKSWKWTLGATAYYTFATLLAGFLAYRVGLLLF